ncbi:MAG: hypothetical protein JWQ27_1461 [Ferruginibacter sp.]|nr:hypothetical protein [Ferruginibacter sp.]
MSYFQQYSTRLLAGFFLATSAFACHNYYKVAGKSALNNQQKSATVDSLNGQSKYFVLRNGDQSFHIRNLLISEDKKNLSFQLDSLQVSHQLHLNNGRKGRQMFKLNNELDAGVIREVHFYISPDSSIARLQSYTIPLEKIQKIEILEKDKRRTTNSYVIGAIGYTLGAAVLVGIIVAATKSSCPFVSAYDGNEFTLQGEIYGGAIYPQLARHDYIPLRMVARSGGTLQLKISNELQEKQFTDIAELWVISHPKNVRVFSDEKGNLFSISQAETPLSARLNQHTDVTKSLLQANDNDILHMDDTTAVQAKNEIALAFKKPADAVAGRLVLTLKNSYFLDLLYSELAKGFGSYYDNYLRQQKSKPAGELIKWTREQQIPLDVSVRINHEWKRISDISTIGPLASRTIVVPLELEPGTAVAEVKLSSGFMFWEIDYAAMDYSGGNEFSLKKLQPQVATDEAGNDVLPSLLKDDLQYLAQPNIGNTATISYQYIPTTTSAETETFILHTKGYYEHIRNFKNKPDIGFLQQFKKPNAFPLFGMELYKKMQKEQLQTLAKAE